MRAAVTAQPTRKGIDAGDQVVVQRRIAVRRRPGVARRLERVAGTIELAAAVIFVTCQGTPAVLVEVEPPFGIDVTLAGIERGLDHPHALQFPADKVRIDVIGREPQIGLGREDELVRVVRAVQFLFAVKLEIVTLKLPIEAEGTVTRQPTAGDGTWAE